MKAKEKAKELLDKFYNKNIQNFWDIEEAIKEAKQSALICVDEIQEIRSVSHDIDLHDYWQEVKQEINKL